MKEEEGSVDEEGWREAGVRGGKRERGWTRFGGREEPRMRGKEARVSREARSLGHGQEWKMKEVQLG